MPVTFEGQQYLTIDEVQGNPELAQNEALRQVRAARDYYNSTDVQNALRANRSETGSPPTASDIIQLRTAIADRLPAVELAFEQPQRLPGEPFEVTVSVGTFAVSDLWPIQTSGSTLSSETAPSGPDNRVDQGRTSPASIPDPAPNDPNVFIPDVDDILGDDTSTDLTQEDRGRLKGAQSGKTTAQQAADEYAGGDIEGGEFGGGPENAVTADGVVSAGSAEAGGGPSSTVKADGRPRDANSNSNQGSGAFKTNIDDVKIDPQENELNDFASYTYGITLWMMSPNEYVKLLQNPTSFSQIPKTLVCRSGGVGKDYSENFDVDFFIDNLTLSNVAASPTRMAANTNAVDISFDITEPRGVTLIERLKEQAKQSLGEGENYITTPYVLEITFRGYDEYGKPVPRIIKPKYIPIKIIELKFSVEYSGAVYKVSAVPYNQNVFNSIRQTIPINLQVKANTVGDIFSNGAKSFKSETVRIEADGDETAPEQQIVITGDNKNLASALNEYFVSLTKPRSVSTTDSKTKKTSTKIVESSDEIADEFDFVLSDDIYKSKLVTANFDALNTPSETSKLFKHFGSAAKGKVDLDASKQIFRINAGTGIISLVNYIVIGSDYIERNIIEEIENGNDDTIPDRPIRWFKVKPKIIGFLGWDKKAGRYKFKVRWDVVPSNVYYNDFPFAPRNKPGGQGVHKVYDYIFSGENTDVQNFKLDFDTAYYQAHTIGTGNPRADKTPDGTFTPETKNNSISKEGESVASDTTLKNKRAKDLFSNIMNDGVDLIDLNLDIIGDPAYLPTGDSFWQDKELRGELYNEAFLPDGTINYDLSPPYIQMNLKTPTDYDDESGLMNPNKVGKFSSSEFSGVYQITEIKSSFSGGLFTQSLKGFRTHIQPIGEKVGRGKESIANTERRIKLQDDLRQFLLASFLGKTANTGVNSSVRITNQTGTTVTSGVSRAIDQFTDDIEQAAEGIFEGAQTAVDRFIDVVDTEVLDGFRDVDQTPRQANPDTTFIDPGVDI